jgi:hypothetical protein
VTYAPINFADKLARFSDHWSPRIIALTIHFRDGQVDLRSGEMFVIPRGVEHKPVAKAECRMMLVERAGTVNTGGVRSELTAKDGVWV